MSKAELKRRKRNKWLSKKIDDDFTPEPIQRDFEDLDTLDKKLLELLIENPALKISELAAESKASYERIYQRVRKEDFREILNRYSEEALNVLLDARLEAAQKVVKIMRDGKSVDSLNACKLVLYGTSTVFDKRYHDVSVKQRTEIINYNISSDFMPDLSRQNPSTVPGSGFDSETEQDILKEIEAEIESIEPEPAPKKRKAKYVRYGDIEVEEDEEDDYF